MHNLNPDRSSGEYTWYSPYVEQKTNVCISACRRDGAGKNWQVSKIKLIKLPGKENVNMKAISSFLFFSTPHHKFLLLSLFTFFTNVCANQLFCWSLSKCPHCNLMKANSHRGGKLLPGNSTLRAVLFIFLFFSCPCWITLPLTSPQNKKSLMLVRTPTVSYCQRSQTEKRQSINWGHAWKAGKDCEDGIQEKVGGTLMAQAGDR